MPLFFLNKTNCSNTPCNSTHFPATQVQQSWAYSRNVVLLAANVHNPGDLMTGGGIYYGRAGPANIHISSEDLAGKQ